MRENNCFTEKTSLKCPKWIFPSQCVIIRALTWFFVTPIQVVLLKIPNEMQPNRRRSDIGQEGVPEPLSLGAKTWFDLLKQCSSSS